MAAGVPVVVSDAPALVEVAGGAALVVPRDDPARAGRGAGRVLVDPTGRAERTRGKGRARAAHYSWSAAARELWRLYSTRAT